MTLGDAMESINMDDTSKERRSIEQDQRLSCGLKSIRFIRTCHICRLFGMKGCLDKAAILKRNRTNS